MRDFVVARVLSASTKVVGDSKRIIRVEVCQPWCDGQQIVVSSTHDSVFTRQDVIDRNPNMNLRRRKPPVCSRDNSATAVVVRKVRTGCVSTRNLSTKDGPGGTCNIPVATVRRGPFDRPYKRPRHFIELTTGTITLRPGRFGTAAGINESFVVPGQAIQRIV